MKVKLCGYWVVLVQSTHQRHVNVAHGCILIRFKNASFVSPEAVGSDVVVLNDTILRGLIRGGTSWPSLENIEHGFLTI